jgi:putative tryptophan/tyrosine transport system substrate-binding protein
MATLWPRAPLQLSRRHLLQAAVGGFSGWTLARCSLPFGGAIAPRPAERPARLGWLGTGPPPPGASPNTDAFFARFGELGYTEGGTYTFHPRWLRPGETDPDQLAAELVADKVAVIVTVALQATMAARKATQAIPIVMVVANDPVAAGLVDSLARPGGNVTGLASLGAALQGKRLELLKETVPELKRVAVVADSRAPDAAVDLREAGTAAEKLSLALEVLDVSQPAQFENAFDRARAWGAEGFLIFENDVTFRNRAQVAALVARENRPAIYPSQAYVAAGGLMSYGTNTPDLFRRAAAFVDRILKGARPGDLPVEQPTTFDLVLNSTVAADLGLTFPRAVLLNATQVIQ